jgi:tRNA (cmo5U34)-methyltransferase
MYSQEDGTGNEWQSVEHVLKYLERADKIPHRVEGETALLQEIPRHTRTILDLGSGDGRLLNLVLTALPAATGVGLDFSPEMIGRLEARFPDRAQVRVIQHNLELPLPELGRFDAVVSSFAIHHVPHPRKREIYGEVWRLLAPGGVFCNLEHVSSPTALLHSRFLEALRVTPDQEDPSNKLLDVETQLTWLREIGFADVDCLWKWRELALLTGRRPATT